MMMWMIRGLHLSIAVLLRLCIAADFDAISTLSTSVQHRIYNLRLKRDALARAEVIPVYPQRPDN